jgi:hypothetical protein
MRQVDLSGLLVATGELYVEQRAIGPQCGNKVVTSAPIAAWRCCHCRRRRAAHPIPAISAKTPNAAIMLPSVSQSISKNPTAAAIAIYLFSIGNCAPSRRPNPRRLRSVGLLLLLTPERLLPGGDGEDGPHELRRCLTGGRGLAPELPIDRRRHRYIDNDHRPRR